MITVLEYLVIAAVIGLVVFVIVVFVFGRGEQMAALSPRTSPSELPDDSIGGEDVRGVRFGLALRGYRMSDVDWTLDRLADELDRLHRTVSELTGQPLPPGVATGRAGEDLFGSRGGDGDPDGPRDGSAPDATEPGVPGSPDEPGSAGQPDGFDDAAWRPAPTKAADRPGSARR